jgi:microcompartment protein CcmK/EutM
MREGPRLDPLLVVSGLLLAGAVAGQPFRTGAMALDVAITIGLGASILLSFGSATRSVIDGRSGLRAAPGVALCVVGIAYGLAVYVPSLMPAPRSAPVSDDGDPCRTLAPIISRWLAEQGPLTGEPERQAAARARALEAWRANLRAAPLPPRLDEAITDADRRVAALIRAWEDVGAEPTSAAVDRLHEARTRATAAVRRLGTACVPGAETSTSPPG